MSNYIELQENLLGNDKNFKALSNEATEKIENVKALLETLRDYSSRIGTSRDSKSFRKNLKEKLMNTTLELKAATDLLNKMERIEVPQSFSMQKSKEIRRLKTSCNDQLKEATELMKSIEKKEKVYVQNARHSVPNNGAESFDQGDQSQSQSKQFMQMNVDEELIRERENDIMELTKLMTEMNAMAKLQGNYLQEQGEEIDIVYEDVIKAKKNIKAAKTEIQSAKGYQDKLVKSDTKCLVIAVIVCIVFIILFLLSGSPEPDVVEPETPVS